MNNSLFLCCTLLFLVVVGEAAVYNQRPIIGVLLQHSGNDIRKYGPNYVAASYVKYLEGAGARVVPVHQDAPMPVLRKLFENLNGLLIPGGGANLVNTSYYYAAKAFYDWSLEAYDQGDIFPVVGHCLGFELLTIITSNNFNILGSVDAENITLPLDFVTDNLAESRMFGNAPDTIMNILANDPVTMNNHEFSLLKTTYDSTTSLNEFYSVLSTNKDRNGVEFISSMESYQYPIFAVQWHPEKPLYEWNPNEVTNHSPNAILAMQYMADFTVSRARLSKHQFEFAAEEERALIYNYQPVYTYYDLPDFEQCYFFDNWKN
uniref:folate gamma-glutamyl hydrolase n=1 Tax=Paramoeba aestuarina TaxID=180227 RepID=A0A7S4PN48_9EUKA|mmetsp:Transcript_9433/g.14306  ORF Transcript_9433/g.14306 Transcript_9433/m.14306 type:complete len:319 (+) Transcript_9433:1078-2034(+)|eukprot:CAMPEP_0201523342 /NCGR_PEP_ID=MMETSP0161_2-20130828/19499_1 /ASSEMBLY_ACC=CAM_ASM_000251 /TAXON_ID=180227 /ORGANISM="Neoparamoeba aestuarina, Strain SoJaBio B1-5/56/2" /LENGTH=318 /DNA_ID=CAMNT_0047922439 /DNA_START=83 /DNA_END=1039 /DNA_ORIENTATION=+